MSTGETAHATQHIRKLHRRIRNLTAVGILLTGLLVGLATVVPFYFTSRSDIESSNQLQAESLADTLHHQLELFGSIARQLASRSEIRHRLEAYIEGDISLDDLRTFTSPKLSDAMAQAPEIAGILRLGPEGETVAKLGTVPRHPHVMALSETSQGYPCRFQLQPDGAILVQACAAIVNDDGKPIGRDVVYFHAAPLVSLLSDDDRFGQDAHMRLFEANGKQVLGLDPEGPALTPMATPHEHGERRVTLETQLDDEGWFLHVEVPSQRFRDEAMTLLVWPTLATLLLALGGSWLGSRALSPLLGKVSAQAARLAETDKALRQAASVFRHAQEAIAITSPDQRLLDANPAFTGQLGYSRERLIGMPITQLLAWQQDSAERLRQGKRQLDREGAWQGEIHYRCANGNTLVALQTISTIRDRNDDIVRYIHIFNDVTEQKAAADQVRYQALHDDLTGLPNRKRLDQHLQWLTRQSTEHATRLAVLFLDLDHFKEVNDSLGHQAGDTLLRAVTARLKASLRADDLLARLGGDEFVIVLHQVQTDDNAATVATHLIEALTPPFDIDWHTARIGVSIGIALYPQDGTTSNTLIQAADTAMYRAKSAGRNTWRYFTPPAASR